VVDKAETDPVVGEDPAGTAVELEAKATYDVAADPAGPAEVDLGAAVTHRQLDLEAVRVVPHPHRLDTTGHRYPTLVAHPDADREQQGVACHANVDHIRATKGTCDRSGAKIGLAT
jgi:hypothetical protein